MLERLADVWHIVAVRDSLLAQRTGAADRTAPLIDLRGTVVERTHAVLVADRNGYYKVRMPVLTARAVVLYGVAAAALLVVAWRQRGGRNGLSRQKLRWRHWRFSWSDIQFYPTMTPFLSFGLKVLTVGNRNTRTEQNKTSLASPHQLGL